MNIQELNNLYNEKVIGSTENKLLELEASVNENTEWKLLNSTIGTTSMALPSSFKELYVVVEYISKSLYYI